jgi:hypothetical protein
MSEGQYYPPNQPPNQPPMQQPGYPPIPPIAPNSSKATTSLVLGICSLVACGLFLGIPAMILGRQAKREIEASQGQLGGEGLATAGFVTGLIGTIWSVLGAILLVVLIVVGGVFANEIVKNCHTVTDSDGTQRLVCTEN